MSERRADRGPHAGSPRGVVDATRSILNLTQLEWLIPSLPLRVLTPRLWAKPLSILVRGNERLDHFGSDEVAIKEIQLVQPKIVTRVISVLRIVWIATEIAKVLHQHKRAVEFLGV